MGSDGPEAPTLALVERLRPTVAAHTRHTPLLRSEWLSGLAGAEVFLKCENLQVTGSFKVRGAFAALEALPGDRRRAGVVAASAGNHGLGLARAASVFGVPCTVVVPSGAPEVKTAGMADLGARVLRSPHPGYDATHAWMLERAGALGGTVISPFDDPAVMAGNGGTTALEILDDLPEPDLLLAPCGGGGLSVGAGTVLRARRRQCRLVGVNTDASPGMWLSRRDGRAHLELPPAGTIAEGLEGGVSERSYRLGLGTLDDVILTRESTLRRSVPALLRREHLLVEGSGAAGVAALLDRFPGAASADPPPGFAPLDLRGKTVVVILTGGNIDGGLLEQLLHDAAEG